MKNKSGVLLVFILGIFCTVNTVQGQQAQPQYNLISLDAPMSKVGIYSMVQDDYGFIWIGTNGSGLYRYDGIEYITYRNDLRDTTSLSSSLVFSTFLDSDKQLWVGTDEGLDLYDRNMDRFQRIKLPVEGNGSNSNVSISSLGEDKNGKLLVGTYGQGLLLIDRKTLEVDEIGLGLDFADNLTIHQIAKSRKGQVYIGTSRGLMVLDSDSHKLKPMTFSNPDKGLQAARIRAIAIDKDDRIWVGTFSRGVFRVTPDHIDANASVKHMTISNNTIMSLLALPDGSLLCASENDGLFHIAGSGEVINHYAYNKNDEKGILSNSIWSLYLDDSQKIWLGYYNKGLAVYDALYDKFDGIESLYNNHNSLQVSSVTAIAQDTQGRYWFGMDGGGIDILEPIDNTFTHINLEDQGGYKGLSSDYIPSVFIDSQDNLWAGSWDNGLFFLKHGSQNFVNFNATNTQGSVPTNTIMSFDEDSKGVIWFGSYHSGLQSYNPKTGQFSLYELEDLGISQAYVWKVLVDSKDNIWLGTTQGLFKWTQDFDGSFSVVSMVDRMAEEFNNLVTANHILSLYEAADGTLWIGTKGAGLCHYDPKTDKFIWHNKYNGLVEENVCSIISDLEGNIWMAGNAGITQYERDTDTFTNYTMNDGLLSNDYNMNAVFRDAKGTLYFGSYQGVDFFEPGSISINTNETSLYLKDFKLFNKKVVPEEADSPLKHVISETDSITLNSNQSVFTIEYSGINYTRPEENQYAYYLEGYEEDWNYVGNSRSATYTNLDPGHYVFKLKASNNDGVWTQEPLALDITILPPWWKTNWAIAAYIGLFSLGLYLLNSLTQNRIQERELVKSEREKRLQEKELNEKKFQFFTNISHEFRTPLTLIMNPLEDILKDASLALPPRVRDKHKIIYRNTERLNRLINELLDFRKLELNKIRVKASEFNVVPFVQMVSGHFVEEALSRNILFEVDTDLPNVMLWGDVGMLEKVVFNVLSNAFKVTPEGGAIDIGVSVLDGQKLPLLQEGEAGQAIEIRISDTGPGLEPEEVSRMFERFYQVEKLNKTYYGGTGIGLEVVDSFVKLHHGRVEVESVVGEGTSFKIILPLGNAHFSQDELLREPVDPFTKRAPLPPTMEASEVSMEQETSKTAVQTILIVEDNTELRDYLKEELGFQYKVLTAKNGKEGLVMALEHLPDVIVTDVIMPEMDGHEFCKHIKSDLRTSHIPLLMLTAKARIDDKIEGAELGADAYMVKPFDMKLLKLRLSQLIKSRQIIFNKYFSAISDGPENVNTTLVDRDFVQKVLNHIHENIADPNLNVERLAASLHLSRSQFYRKIKALTNQTANEFIRNARLQKAKQYLENGDTNISSVCYKVGFSSPSYFTKCFKEYFGVLPTALENQTG